MGTIRGFDVFPPPPPEDRMSVHKPIWAPQNIDCLSRASRPTTLESPILGSQPLAPEKDHVKPSVKGLRETFS